MIGVTESTTLSFMKMIVRWWKDLSVAKKLFTIVGAMAILIAAELFTLWFAMQTLSAVRAFVAAEGLWSKAQKHAVHSLLRYASDQDAKHFAEFRSHLKVPLGDHKGRVALEKPVPDLEGARAGFLEGGVNPAEIDGMIRLLLNFNTNRYIAKAIQVWREGDTLLDEFIKEGEILHAQISSGKTEPREIKDTLARIDRLNDELTVLENNFSSTLGEGSRWLEKILMMILLLAVVSVEGTGLVLTGFFSRGLVDNLNELSEAAERVGRGDFHSSILVHSRDELGRLAESINNMMKALEENIGSRKQAEVANEAKSMFLANMSHEIRTPLSAILGFAELLKDKDLSEAERVKYLEVINRTGNNLTHIVNDILDLSKIEAGHFELEMQAFSLENLLRDLHIVLSFRAARKSLELLFRREGNVPDWIESDPARLRQVLMNIVGNAIKFTQDGRVIMNYSATPTHIRFVVQDSGIGISEVQARTLFQPFVQADNSLTRRHEGTGLGLVVSRQLAQALGGDVVLLKSQPGEGSTFEIKIAYQPAASKTEVTPTTARVADLRGKRILVVEDSPDNQMLVQLALAKTGATVVLANNGEEGKEIALHDHFDVVLMDMQMPVLDGYRATQALRATGYKQPIIALTAFAMKEDREKCLKSGCTDYLSKPLDLRLLVEKVQYYIELAAK